ncbi:MAG: HU family DNA-binding protein [Gemmatimonadota bacterium]
MNKQEMVEAVAKALESSKAHAGVVVDTFFGDSGVIASTLKKGGEVNITGFGSFKVRKRAARMGRNPQTGKAISIKASKAPVFKAGKSLKDMVNKK